MVLAMLQLIVYGIIKTVFTMFISYEKFQLFKVKFFCAEWVSRRRNPSKYNFIKYLNG